MIFLIINLPNFVQFKLTVLRRILSRIKGLEWLSRHALSPETTPMSANPPSSGIRIVLVDIKGGVRNVS